MPARKQPAKKATPKRTSVSLTTPNGDSALTFGTLSEDGMSVTIDGTDLSVDVPAQTTRQAVVNTLRQVWEDDYEDNPEAKAKRDAALANQTAIVAQATASQQFLTEQSDAYHPLPTPANSPAEPEALILPVGWDVLSDEARQIALDEANRAIERGASDADAITAGVIAAKLWATEHGVNVRK